MGTGGTHTTREARRADVVVATHGEPAEVAKPTSRGGVSGWVTPLTDRDLATARGRSIEGMEECQCTLAMRFSFGLRGMTCRYIHRSVSTPLCRTIKADDGSGVALSSCERQDRGPRGARGLFPTTAWRCSRRVILVSSSEGTARSRREVLVSLHTHGGRVQRKWYACHAV